MTNFAGRLAEPPEAHLAWIRQQVQVLAGDVSTDGVEMVRLVKIAANLFDAAVGRSPHTPDVSGPRWGLLMHLWFHELRGDADGLSPTYLSQSHRVSKNTISALLRGLERQGYIERALDPHDRRVFRIRLTDAGRARVRTMTPHHVALLNGLVDGLSPAERAQLIGLLGKLCSALLAHAGAPRPPCLPDSPLATEG